MQSFQICDFRPVRFIGRKKNKRDGLYAYSREIATRDIGRCRVESLFTSATNFKNIYCKQWRGTTSSHFLPSGYPMSDHFFFRLFSSL